MEGMKGESDGFRWALPASGNIPQGSEESALWEKGGSRSPGASSGGIRLEGEEADQ